MHQRAAPHRPASRKRGKCSAWQHILVITNDLDTGTSMRAVLGSATAESFEVQCVASLAIALERLAQESFSLVAADLTLPDAAGLEVFDQLHAAAPKVPIVILCIDESDTLAQEAVLRGAQGFLSRGHFTSNLVPLTLNNIIQRRLFEQAWGNEKTRAEIALNSISDAVICTDMHGNVDYLNRAAEGMTGWSRRDANGRPIAEVFHIINGQTREAVTSPVSQVLALDEVRSLNANTTLINRDGSESEIEDSLSPIHDWDGQLTGAVIVFHDISAAQAMTRKMAHLAQHDFLTNLPNRLLLNDRIAQALTAAKRHSMPLTLLFLDLDNFKNINDSLGHSAGDKLLQSVAARLQASVRGADTVSRQGGDELLVMLTECKVAQDAAITARKVLAAMALPHLIEEHEIHVTTSIGISVFPFDGADAETLIKCADTAMYHAKERGRNNYQYFTADMNIKAVERQLVEAHLRQAIDRKEFTLHYQPKINLASGHITGVEALLRWQHPLWGMVYPTRFVSVAEDSGLIVPIGRWVLREACGQSLHWQASGMAPLSVAVNISAVEFRHAEFYDSLAAILQDTGFDARLLQLEITESVLMRDVQSAAAILSKLKALGVQIAVDDFGTGYSSLSYLQQFPIDVLKIDQSFVSDIHSATDEGIIVSAVIAMGNSLKMHVIAEGVETPAQLVFLRARLCEEGQGYHFNRPMPPDELQMLVSAQFDGRCHGE